MPNDMDILIDMTAKLSVKSVSSTACQLLNSLFFVKYCYTWLVSLYSLYLYQLLRNKRVMMHLLRRYGDVLKANWHVGFTAFGGPAVQFQTFHERFVEHLQWIDEPTYQQIFAVSQALPGSASVKMLFCINTIHGGFPAGTLAILMFSLPGAIGMYGLAVGVAHIGSTLPNPVYALLSGLNAATVGIIALAAVRLSERAITDKLTRFLVYLGGAMGMLYTALWYYPAIMAGAALTTLVWDFGWLQKIVGALKRCRRKSVEKKVIATDLEEGPWSCDYSSSQKSQETLHPPSSVYTKRESELSIATFENPRPAPSPAQSFADKSGSISTSKDFSTLSWQMGTAIVAFFVISFIAILTVHFVTGLPSRAYSLFSSLYLAGTIIFGGGPVVIPLLREYIVSPGWVSPRDFLLGLAIIQSFPGPNFNFAVYLGALAVVGTSVPSYIGALIGFIAMYAPGMFIVVGFMGLWRLLREEAWFLAILRGINAAAVGLVFTAVYKLWQIGYLTAAVQSGSPLGTDPWLVAITGTAYVGGAWFKMSPPVAILLGGAMGVARYGIFNR